MPPRLDTAERQFLQFAMKQQLNCMSRLTFNFERDDIACP